MPDQTQSSNCNPSQKHQIPKGNAGPECRLAGCLMGP